MKLDTPIGLFTVHFWIRPPVDPVGQRWPRRMVVATLHRGACIDRVTAGVNAEGLPCGADSPAVAEITTAKRRPFRRDVARSEALAKAMLRLGLNKEERVHLWRSYFGQVNVSGVPRVCVGVETRCPAGHRHIVKAIGQLIWDKRFGGEQRALFPSAREFCGYVVIVGQPPAGTVCEQPTIEAKHRYLYEVTLPPGRAERRRRAL